MSDYAVVSGGSGALGTAVVDRLSRAGKSVVVLDRATPASPGREHRVVDLCDAAAVAGTIDALVSERGAPSTLVMCQGWSPKAADGRRADEVDVPVAEFRDVLEVNLTSCYQLLRLVVPAMAAAGGGRVVVVGSAAAHTGRTTAGAGYAAAKAGLSALVRVFAVRYGPSGVLVNDVSPGKITNPAWPDHPASVADYRREVPLGRLAGSDEVAEAISFLVSAANTYLTGQTVIVDGGRLA